MEQKYRALPRFALATALLLLSLLLLLGGTAYARYRTVQEQPISFEAAAESTLTIIASDLDTSSSTWINTITVCNDSGEELRFTPTTLVSLGIGSQNNAVLTFNGGGYVVEGVGAAITEGSLLYDSFGPGWYYQYPTVSILLADGEELSFEIIISPGTVINGETGEEEPATFPEDSMVQTELIIEH